MADSNDKHLRDHLHLVFGRAKVPTNPAIAIEILRLVDDPTSSAEQFAAVIEADPSLAAKLLEMANSATFARRHPVTTIKRAVTLLGMRRIRMVTLGFQLVGHLNRLGDAPFDLPAFWQQSVLRACLAREIASEVVPSHAEEAFLVGLLQDCGIVLLVQLFGEAYASMCRDPLSPTAFYECERRVFEHDHTSAVRLLAEEWRLPGAIAEPLARHHQRPELAGPMETWPELNRLWAVSYLVGSLPFGDGVIHAPGEPGLQAFADATLRLDEAAMSACVKRAGEAYDQVAPLLGDSLPTDPDITALLEAANERLARVASQAAEALADTEAERDRIQAEQSQLQTALGQYRERAARDPLTRLLNRGALLDAAQSCLRSCADATAAVAVMFLDLDDFKSVNDRFGHQAGDKALQRVADTLSRASVNGGVVARYGGEEFVLMLPDVTERAARETAAEIVGQIRRLSDAERGLVITGSMGCVWGQPVTGATPQEWFATADSLMYQAKVDGKDRCCFCTAEAPDSITTLDIPSVPSELDDEDAPDVPEAVFRRIAEDLNRDTPKKFVTQRKRERQPLMAACKVNSFTSGTTSVHSRGGFLRNISTGGVGVLTTRPMVRGEPIEVVFQQPGRSGALYMGGVVAFCRHVRDGIYEIGVQLVTRSRTPLLARDTSSPSDQLDWVYDALQASLGEDEERRESA